MSKKQKSNGRRSEIIVHPEGWKQLLRCVVLADNRHDALNIVRFHHPNEKISHERIVFFQVYPKAEQLNLL